MPEIWFPHLNIEIYTLDRVAFTLFGLDVYWYGIFIALAFIVGLFVADFNGKRVSYNTEIIFDFIPYGMIFSIIGARIYYVLFSFSYYKDHLNEIFSLRDGGLGVYGGIICAFFALFLYSKKRNINFLESCDVAIPGVAIGQAIGRWGNFFNKEAFGGYTDNLFAMRLRTDIASFVPKNLEILTFNGADYIQVHPTFFYESVMDLSISIFLLLFYKNKKFDGHIFCLYFALYGFGRFFIESLREDQLMFLGIPISMAVSFIFVALSVTIILKNTKKLGK